MAAAAQPTPHVFDSESLRLLRLLAAPAAYARVSGPGVSVLVERGGVTLGAGRGTCAALRGFETQGLLTAEGIGPRRNYRLNDAGRDLALRFVTGDLPGEHAQRHMTLTLQARAGAPGLLVNEAESPLLWLRRRKGRDGAALIGEAEFMAGERLRADIDRAQMLPRLTADWERPASGGGGAALNAPEARLAAKARVDRALSEAGPEFSGLLLDVCGFLKPIDQIERERGWPARSAKVVLGLALARLARHYGYANAAAGRARGRIQRWQSGGERPAFPGAAR